MIDGRIPPQSPRRSWTAGPPWEHVRERRLVCPPAFHDESAGSWGGEDNEKGLGWVFEEVAGSNKALPCASLSEAVASVVIGKSWPMPALLRSKVNGIALK